MFKKKNVNVQKGKKGFQPTKPKKVNPSTPLDSTSHTSSPYKPVSEQRMSVDEIYGKMQILLDDYNFPSYRPPKNK